MSELWQVQVIPPVVVFINLGAGPSIRTAHERCHTAACESATQSFGVWATGFIR